MTREGDEESWRGGARKRALHRLQVVTLNLDGAPRTRVLMLQETRVAEEEWHAVDRRAALLGYHVYRVAGGTYRGRWVAQQLQSHTDQKLLHYRSKSGKSGNGPNIAGTHASVGTLPLQFSSRTGPEHKNSAIRAQRAHRMRPARAALAQLPRDEFCSVNVGGQGTWNLLPAKSNVLCYAHCRLPGATQAERTTSTK